MSPRLRLFGRLTLANVSRHRMRWSLTVFGIALGITSFIGVVATNRSVIEAFEHSVTRGAGKAQLQVTNGSAGVDTGLVDAIASVLGVETASGNVQYAADLDAPEGRLTVLGVQMGRDDAHRREQFGADVLDVGDTLVFLAATDSIALSDEILRERNWTIGSSFEVLGPNGPRRLTVRGVLHTTGVMRVFGGRVGLMDAEAAQRAFGTPDTLHWIDVVVRPDVPVDEVAGRITVAIQGRGTVDSPVGRGKRIEAMLGSLRTLLGGSALVALLVGMFLIYHTVNTAVAQRQDQLSTLWALGAPRRQLLAYLMAEAVLVGLLGAGLGIAAGLGFAWLAAGAFGQMVSDMYTQIPPSPSITLEPAVLLVALALGVLVELAGAAMPSLRVLRTGPEPVPGRLREVLASPAVLAGAGALALLLAVGVAQLSRTESFALRVASFAGCAAFVFAGSTALVPLLVASATPLLRRLLRSRWGSLGGWAWEQVGKRRMHTLTTMGSLASGVAFALAMTIMLGSYRRAFADWIRDFAKADVFVTAGAAAVSLLGGPTIELGFLEQLEDVPGVHRVMPWRLVDVSFRGRPVIVQGAAEALIERAHPGLSLNHDRGEVVVSDSLAERYGVAVGDVLTLPAPRAPLQVTVAAIAPDYVLDLGNVKVGWRLFVRHFAPQGANLFVVDATPGTPPVELARRIEALARGRYELSVLTQREVRSLINDLIERSFALTYWLQLLAVIVVTCAMVNATSAAIIDREDDLVALRALGMQRGRLVRLLMVEAALVGALGGLLGLAAGAVFGATLVTTVMPAVAGFRLPAVWPLGAMLALLVLTTVSASAAAYVIARRWTRRPLVVTEEPVGA